MTADLDAVALSILKDNDLGGYTIPTKGLYPYQWNWDSVFVAFGFATFDLNRAWTEIENLFEGQWADGMVPHILFRKNDPSYFPGPGVWGTKTEPFPTSGHSQPPVAATAVRDLLEMSSAADNIARAKVLFPKLMDWHRWWATYRDPKGHGSVAIVHPWESGRDNLPDWDEPLSMVGTEGVGEYTRKDTSHVDPEMRPKKLDYDRYMAILNAGKSVGWDARKTVEVTPFLVADPGITMILLRANRDLLVMADRLGFNDDKAEIESWIAQLERGLESLWNPAINAYVTRNLRTDVMGTGVSSASFLASYAGVTDPKVIEPMQAHFDRIAGAAEYMLPSYDPAHEGFEHKRYWRGPVWAVVNYMAARGMREAGDLNRAEKIRHDTVRLIEKSGFAEYFSPVDGSGAGGKSFSWTAAVWLAWATPSLAANKAA
ncbi:MGH1-like glycoside hydrolase domain-containing protein [Roseibium sp.]|uniref:MGH1-like glycoside hydrolase domain-containing protein n=1 Tax=Roseibium sp. TaxID=1936156 RepID=UPI003A96C2EB